MDLALNEMAYVYNRRTAKYACFTCATMDESYTFVKKAPKKATKAWRANSAFADSYLMNFNKTDKKACGRCRIYYSMLFLHYINLGKNEMVTAILQFYPYLVNVEIRLPHQPPCSPLIAAMMHSRCDLVDYMLSLTELDINKQYGGRSALLFLLQMPSSYSRWIAKIMSHENTYIYAECGSCNFCINYDADYSGKAVVHFALYGGNLATIKYVLSRFPPRCMTRLDYWPLYSHMTTTRPPFDEKWELSVWKIILEHSPYALIDTNACNSIDDYPMEWTLLYAKYKQFVLFLAYNIPIPRDGIILFRYCLNRMISSIHWNKKKSALAMCYILYQTEWWQEGWQQVQHPEFSVLDTDSDDTDTEDCVVKSDEDNRGHASDNVYYLPPVPSLQNLSRTSIRRQLSLGYVKDKMKTITYPSRLKSYICYEEDEKMGMQILKGVYGVQAMNKNE